MQSIRQAQEAVSIALRAKPRRIVETATAAPSRHRPVSIRLNDPSPNRFAMGLDGIRRWAVLAPQFQETFVLAETFAFNLLMGRGWPPGPGDMEEAEVLCRELGLGPLLDRMPAGLLQMVGESGWQLSHGERSRLFLARART